MLTRSALMMTRGGLITVTLLKLLDATYPRLSFSFHNDLPQHR